MASSRTVEKRTLPVAFAAPRIFVLAVAEGPDPSLVHRINRKKTVIGRDPSAHFVLPDDEVSGAHLEIMVDGPNCYVSDLGSLNGTEHNGRRLEAGGSVRLRPLDELRLGRTRLVFLRGEFARD